MTDFTDEDAAANEDLWAKEMIQIYEDAAAIGYEASGFRGLVASHGPLRAAKMLINMDEPSDGFTELWNSNDWIFQSRRVRSNPSFVACFQTQSG